MKKASIRRDDHLDAVLRGREVLADAVREQPTTHTVARSIRKQRVTLARWWIAFSLAVLALAACGGGKRSDTYAKATQAQEQCCENLQGDARADCLKKIVRVSDADVQKTSINQQQYACVVEHFTCDAKTGHATQASAQQQYDCIAELEQ